MIPAFEWYTLVPVFNKLPPHVAHSLIVAAIIIGLALIANRQIATAAAAGTPSGKTSVGNVFEAMYETISGLLQESLGHHSHQFLALVGGFAFFILFSNVFGLIPGFAPPTDNINVTAALGLTVFFATHYYGVKAHGLSYLKQFVGPFWWLAWLMIPIEVISHLARPLSLSLRLFGNMMGDHLVFSIFVLMSVSLTKFIVGGPVFGWIFAPVAPLMPMIALFLGLFVCFVQTFVFLLLSMTYFAGAVSDHH
jgi:F-type H+-transporting ATPase subunit a